MVDLTPDETRLFDRLRAVIDKTCMRVWSEEFGTLTQEPALTATIAAAIRNELEHHPLIVGKLTIEVMSRNVPDRGSRSMESINGSDLYISLVRRDRGISKGVILQSKWENELFRPNKRLRNQSLRMCRRSEDGSYVLVFGPTGISVVPAERSTYPQVPRDFLNDGVSLGTLISEGLKCNAGDPELGRDLDLPAPEGIDRVLREISGVAEPALDLQVKRLVTSRMRLKAG